jgi:hypothetical protein
MPYRVTFIKPADAQAVAARILPALRERFGNDLEAAARKWGCAIAFNDGAVAIAIDIVPEPESRHHIDLTSRTRRFAWLKRIADVPQLEEVKRIVAGEIAEWTGKLPDVVPL